MSSWTMCRRCNHGYLLGFHDHDILECNYYYIRLEESVMREKTPLDPWDCGLTRDFAEKLYQAFKARLIKELELSEPMTPEEFIAWKEKMVVKK